MPEILQRPQLITVFGGGGFLGRHVVRTLVKRGYLVRVACRRPDLAGYLLPLGSVGQIQLVQSNVRVRWAVDRAVQGAAHVVNLAGIAFETGRQRFDAVHDFGARAIAEAARAAGIGLTHVSAIGASLDSASDYEKTKARGEVAVRETISSAVILRPATLFGPDDNFFNRFANLARFTPALPLVGGGQTKLQPVFAGDVAEAVALAVDGKLQAGTTYELGGPQVMTFRECMEVMLSTIDRKRFFVSVPWPIASLQASILGLLPNPLLTPDQVVMLKTDKVVSSQATSENRTFQGMDVQPRTLEVILPAYMWRYRPAGQFQRSSSEV